jgi:ATP-binding cassette subfamily B protein
VVRAYAQEEAELARFEAANREHLRRNRELIKMFGSLYPGIQLLMGSGVLLVIWLGGRMVIAGTITLGEFVAFGAYLAMLHWPMIALGWVVNLFERGEASMGRIGAMLDAVPAIRDEQPLPVTEIKGDVDFRGLSFGYGALPVLHDIDLRVPAGTTVAIVGPTGSGKSTLVSLIPRLFDAPPAKLFVDAHDVRTIPLATLRGAIGFVPAGDVPVLGVGAREHRLRARRTACERVEWAAAWPSSRRTWPAFPRATRPSSASAGITLSAARSSAPRSRAPSRPTQDPDPRRRALLGRHRDREEILAGCAAS